MNTPDRGPSGYAIAFQIVSLFVAVFVGLELGFLIRALVMASQCR